MRIGLTAKLLLVLGLTSAVSVIAMALAARWSFQHGFIDYLGQQELKRLDPLGDALLQAYGEHGSWEFFERAPGLWPRFADEAIDPDADGLGERRQRQRNAPGRPGMQQWRPPQPRLPPRPSGRHDAATSDLSDDRALDADAGPRPRPGSELGLGRPPPGPFERGEPGPRGAPPFDHPGGRPPGPGFGPPPPPPRFSQLVARLRLLDHERQPIAGMARATEDEMLRPLVADGVVVAWLALSRPLWLEDELAKRFNSQHNRSLLWIALAALTLAMLLGALFGEAILRRIRAVAAGARQLAKGNYGVRVERKGRDELAGLAEDFNHLALALERSEELRRSGMADVSHELRTPLAVARAELDALIDGIRPCNKERLEQLHGRLMTLGRLLDDLYDLALSDSGALNYRYESVDLAEVLRAAIDGLRESFDTRGIELRLQIEDELLMDGDRGRLRQVMDNLLGNSLRYTDGGGFIRVLAQRSGNEILVSMADTPPGVDPAALERLFDRFYRVEASRSRAKGGAGLGMAICRNIIEAHRGTINARPADSGGLAIDIRLPASRD